MSAVDGNQIQSVLDIVNSGVQVVTLVVAAGAGFRKRRVTGEPLVIHADRIEVLSAEGLVVVHGADIERVEAA